MAIFNKLDQQADYSSNITTIASGTKLFGKLEVACQLHIDGEIEGDIASENVVSIGKPGLVKGAISADKLIVSGKYFGDANCNSIELASGGEVQGNLTTSSLSIAADSAFEGQSIRRGKGDSAQSIPKVVGIGAERNLLNQVSKEKKLMPEDKEQL